jgi:hypothetical protein
MDTGYREGTVTRALVSMFLASAMLSTLAAGPAAAKPKEIVVVGSSPAKTKMWAWKPNPQRVNGTIYQAGPGPKPRVGIAFMQNFKRAKH